MEITVPVTDYIRESILTANGDAVLRVSGAAARVPMNCAFMARKETIGHSVTTGTWTTVQCTTEDFDVGGDYDAVTNFDFEAPTDGYYLFLAGAYMDNLVAGNTTYLRLYDGATEYARDIQYVLAGYTHSILHVFAIISLSATDTVYPQVYHNKGANATVGNVLGTYFAGAKLLIGG